MDYKQKYYKYKTKYIDLKNKINMIGGFNPNTIKWIRGTNSSIFLSCYFENNKWYLMSKGYQIYNGFVPMSETIDPGILSISGVNWEYISAYEFDKINISGSYALRLNIFNLEETKQKLSLELQKEDKNKIEIIYIIYYFLRIKQFTGNSKSVEYYYNLMVTNNLNKIILERYVKIKEFLDLIITLFNSDLNMYKQQLNFNILDNRELYAKLENEIRKKYNLPEKKISPYFAIDPNFVTETNITDYIFKNYKKYYYPMINGSHTWNNYITNIILTKLLVDSNNNEYIKIKKEVIDYMNKHLDFLKNLIDIFNYAIDPNIQSKYVLNTQDKKILESPISLIICSRKITGEIIHTFEEDDGKKYNELGIKNKIEIGNNGADLIIVKNEQDKIKLIELLRNINFNINEIEIVVKTEYFITKNLY